jgi:sulfane dehydrogenase subunit SoxC
MKDDRRTGRRQWLGLTAALGAAMAACKETASNSSATGRMLGAPVSDYGSRSPYETAKRLVGDTRFPENFSTRTPLQDSAGILTPSSLHFERHHAGVPAIDPAQHKLLIHGMVDRPTIFTIDELKRLPSASHIYFVECSGNSSGEWNANPKGTLQQIHGLASCSEWTGVPLSMLLEEAGVRKGAAWLLAEGADPCKMQRSLPLSKAMDDILVAWGQNGEALRPEQGYPLRLIVPGFEGNVNVKWLRRIEVTDDPYMTRDETSHYTDLMPDGTARQFTFLMEAKSLITYPSPGRKLTPGFCEIAGLAWTGRGRIAKVEVSVDGGAHWQIAALQEPVLPKAFTRFRLPWRWDGSDAELQSRSTDETGYVQPSRQALVEARGVHSQYHHNGIVGWKLNRDGSLSHA